LRLAILPLSSQLPRCRRNVSDARVTLSYETIREWCLKFGQSYANGLRRRSPRPGDRWHLDEVFLKINGRLHSSGARSIRMATCWISRSRPAEIRRRVRNSSASY
jgi:hypothetical protein